MKALQHAGYHTSGIGKFHYLQTWPWKTPRGKVLDLHGMKDQMKEYGFDEIWETAGKQLMLKNYCDWSKYLDDKGLLETYLDFVEKAGPNSPYALSPGAENADQDMGNAFSLDEADYMDIVTADKIIERIKERPSDKPFYLFGSFCSPHKPFDPPLSYLDKVDYEERDDFIPGEQELTAEARRQLWKKRRAYKAMILLIDDQVGRICDTLESEGILDDTVILFTSDHGEMLGDHGRIQKSSYYKESVQVPCLIRHPDHLERREIADPVETNDIVATILEIAGLDPQAALSMNWPGFQDRIPCRSLLPALTENKKIREMSFSECNGAWEMTFDGRYKYIRHIHYARPGGYREELYDLKEDPCEQRNMIADPELARQIKKHRDYRDYIKDYYQPCQTSWAELHL